MKVWYCLLLVLTVYVNCCTGTVGTGHKRDTRSDEAVDSLYGLLITDEELPADAESTNQHDDEFVQNTKLLVLIIDGLRWDIITPPADVAVDVTSYVTPPDVAPPDVTTDINYRSVNSSDDTNSTDVENEAPYDELFDDNTANKAFENHPKMEMKLENPVHDSVFQSIRNEGVTAAWNIPVFPTTAAPNIYTMMTGLLPATHGVLSENPSWRHRSNTLFPLWKMATFRGHKTAVLRVHDCLTAVPEQLTCIPDNDVRSPDNLLVQLTFDATIASKMLVEDGYSFVILRTKLFEEAAKHYGLFSPVTMSYLTEMDLILETLRSDLQQAGVYDQTGILVVSSSGLADLEEAVSVTPLEDCLISTDVEFRYRAAGSAILTGSSAAEVVTALDSCDQQYMKTLQWYKNSELPLSDQWIDGENDLLLVAHTGTTLLPSVTYIPDTYNRTRKILAGAGYDVNNDAMRGVFIAKGPGLKAGVVTEPIHQTDVYQMMCLLLGLTPLDSHLGHTYIVHEMFEPSRAPATDTSHALLISCSFILTTVTIFNMFRFT